MAKYLYGANIKSVQQFIFQTGKLTEIIGASEIVEEICTALFEQEVENLHNPDSDFKNNLIISAAGIIKYVFNKKEDCEEIVRTFPKTVYNKAPGIVLAQAVVKLNGNEPTNEESAKLEDRLRIRRNKAMPPTETGLRIIERSRRTGLPAIKFTNDEVIDRATSQKQDHYIKHKKLGKKLDTENEIHFVFQNNIDNIKSKGNYVAVIHADGNNMGKTIRELNERNDSAAGSIGLNRKFSSAVNDITLAAAKNAVKETFKFLIEETNPNAKGLKVVTIPLRPVIMGGDDFTVICGAEYALDLTKNYLAEFEKKAHDHFKTEFAGLNSPTSCAGIAYVKSNYPFHYAVRLAEELCDFSKNEAKKINNQNVPSCLTFYRVLSSFIGEFNTDILNRELTAAPAGLNLCGGPYFTSTSVSAPKIDDLLKMVTCLQQDNTPVSKIREWISTCHVDKILAIEDLKRIIQILEEKDLNKTVETLDLKSLLKKIEDRKEDDTLLIKTSLYDALIMDSLIS